MKKYEIGLKRRKAYKKIDELLTLLSERYNVEFLPKKNYSVLRAETHRDDVGQVSYVRIGVNELVPMTLSRLNSDISVDTAFLSAVASAFHEEGHVIQYTEKFQHDFSDDALAMSLEDIATFKNSYYYRDAIISNLEISVNKAMYYYNLCELDAERHAVRKLHEYVEREFSSVDADAAVLQYVNFKCNMEGNYFLDGSYSTYSEVLKELDFRFELSKSFSSVYVRQVKNLPHKDIAYQNCLEDRRLSYDDFCKAYLDDHVAKHIAQDRLVAAATVLKDDSLLQSHPNLDGLNLDLYYVIKHPLVKSGLLSEQIQEDKGHARAMDLDNKFGSILESASKNHDGHSGLGE